MDTVNSSELHFEIIITPDMFQIVKEQFKEIDSNYNLVNYNLLTFYYDSSENYYEIHGVNFASENDTKLAFTTIVSNTADADCYAFMKQEIIKGCIVNRIPMDRLMEAMIQLVEENYYTEYEQEL